MGSDLRCRCGGAAAQRCMTCGAELVGKACNYHPAANVERVTCMYCDEALCFWHYTLETAVEHRPSEVGGMRIVRVIKQRCFPSCKSTFGAPVAKKPDAKRPMPAVRA